MYMYMYLHTYTHTLMQDKLGNRDEGKKFMDAVLSLSLTPSLLLFLFLSLDPVVSPFVSLCLPFVFLLFLCLLRVCVLAHSPSFPALPLFLARSL